MAIDYDALFGGDTYDPCEILKKLRPAYMKITVEGSRGVRAHFYLSITAEDQAIGAAVFDTFDLRPGYSTDGVPKIVTVGASSALTLTDPG